MINNFDFAELRVKEKLKNVNFTAFGELVQVKQKGENLAATGSHFEKAHFGAFIWHLIGYERYIKDKTGQDLSVQERAKRYVDAFLCLCQLDWYKEAKHLFDLPLKIDEQTSFPLYKQLRIWGRYEDEIKLCKGLLGHLDDATNFICLNELGYIYRELGQFPKALKYAEQLLSLAEELNNSFWKARGEGNIATIYGILGEYEKAKKSLEQTLNLAQLLPESPEKNEIVNVAYLNLGNFYGYQGQIDQAISCFNQHLKWTEDTQNYIDQATAFRNLGEAFHRINDLKNAFSYTQKSLELSQEFHDEAGIIFSLGNLGAIYGQQGNFAQAQKCFEEEKKKASDISDLASLAHACIGLGEIYSITQKDDLAYQHLQQGLDIAQKIGEQYLELETLIRLAEFEEKTHDIESGINYWKQALILAQELNNLSLNEKCEQNLKRLLDT
ncbi:tetratricopeptide repeat protein [Gloeothece verrucosa]|uniref:Tetratricopeptide TPR_2 repeat protein n=1 Tax=Gloeothece verrucosa (strain PCC 7822) TaxID=497965 RepID=E0UMH6_GLOV7|nr:tetratricopeptide repeat protein [Gloeothece verrucosa]ADN18156.1 Tetratricopeptide TPR_2 repeat protein [Gloeothece verrucosa PCC 7822]